MLNKNLIILTICQVFSFTAPPITVFISGIVGLKISPIASLATLPTSLSIVGTAVFSFFAAIAAKKENTAVPTIDNDVGRVANDAIGEIFKPTIPLIKTVIGGAVKEKTWQIVKIIKFLLSIL